MHSLWYLGSHGSLAPCPGAVQCFVSLCGVYRTLTLSCRVHHLGIICQIVDVRTVLSHVQGFD
jgi:hypothetical protein